MKSSPNRVAARSGSACSEVGEWYAARAWGGQGDAGGGKSPRNLLNLTQVDDSFMASLMRFSRFGHAVFALLIWRWQDYLSLRNDNATGRADPSLARLEVTAMKMLFSFVEGGFVATIALGVFAATADITTIASMAL